MRFLIILTFCLFHQMLQAQDFSQYATMRFTTAAEYRKIEPHVILASDLVLSTPIEKNNTNRENAIKLVMKWIGGTSDYSFVADKYVSKFTGNNPDLIAVYLVALAKITLESEKNTDRETIRLAAYNKLCEYCSDPLNSYTPVGEMKKMIAAYRHNDLKAYLEAKSK